MADVFGVLPVTQSSERDGENVVLEALDQFAHRVWFMPEAARHQRGFIVHG